MRDHPQYRARLWEDQLLAVLDSRVLLQDLDLPRVREERLGTCGMKAQCVLNRVASA